nr:hypothetical protein Iba_chr02bCG10440 [Ipomoea batatas]GME13387.1 hypothetical protein Iba_scaffold14398CG0070 [Ipomoea batatas]
MIGPSLSVTGRWGGSQDSSGHDVTDGNQAPPRHVGGTPSMGLGRGEEKLTSTLHTCQSTPSLQEGSPNHSVASGVKSPLTHNKRPVVKGVQQRGEGWSKEERLNW